MRVWLGEITTWKQYADLELNLLDSYYFPSPRRHIIYAIWLSESNNKLIRQHDMRLEYLDVEYILYYRGIL